MAEAIANGFTMLLFLLRYIKGLRGDSASTVLRSAVPALRRGIVVCIAAFLSRRRWWLSGVNGNADDGAFMAGFPFHLASPGFAFAPLLSRQPSR